MSTITTNYKLKKPDLSDVADISVLNGNMDIIDAEIKKVDNKVNGITIPVTSVNSKTGAVVLDAGSVGAVANTITVNSKPLTDNVALTKADIGLANVVNESKTTMFNNPTFTGMPVAPTPAVGTNSTQLATTGFVTTAIANKTSVTGNAGSATKLANARVLNGVPFDGSADIVIPVPSSTQSDIKDALDKSNAWDTFKRSGGEVTGIIKSTQAIEVKSTTHDESARLLMVDGQVALRHYLGGTQLKNLLVMDVNTKTTSLPGPLNILGGYIGGYVNGVVLGKDGVVESRIQSYHDDGINMFAPSVTKVMDLGAPTNRFKDLWVGEYLTEVNGYVKLTNGYIMQWVTVTLDFNSSQTHDVGVTYPLGFIGDGYGNCWCNVRSSSTSTKYVVANVTATNRVTCILRASSTKAITGTIDVRVYALGTI